MEFSRRRFLTIASAAVSSLFIPLATHGSAKAIVAATPDRYALVAGAWRDAMDEIPEKFKGLRVPPARGPFRDEYFEMAMDFTKKADRAVALMLEHFEGLPTEEEVKHLFKSSELLPDMDEEHLRAVSENLLPISIMRSVFLKQKAPMQVLQMDNINDFTNKYKSVLLS